MKNFRLIFKFLFMYLNLIRVNLSFENYAHFSNGENISPNYLITKRRTLTLKLISNPFFTPVFDDYKKIEFIT